MRYETVNDNDELLIYHIFADRGVESEYLSNYGRVVRVGLDPVENDYSEAVQGDATSIPLKPGADLVVLHPPCYEWSKATAHSRKAGTEYPDLLEKAREIGGELGDHYIIENVPEAPLRDPVVLNGRHFNMPIKYERAFETSFPVTQPREKGKREDEATWWFEFSRPRAWWQAAKGGYGPWEKNDLVKVTVPKQYLDYLFQFYFAERYDMDTPVTESPGLDAFQ